jgi:hypothetical protein
MGALIGDQQGHLMLRPEFCHGGLVEGFYHPRDFCVFGLVAVGRTQLVLQCGTLQILGTE